MCPIYTWITSYLTLLLDPSPLNVGETQGSVLNCTPTPPQTHSLAYLCKYDCGCQLSLGLTSFLNCIYSIASSKSPLECLINILTYTKMKLLVFAPQTDSLPMLPFSVQFSCSVVSNSLHLHGLQHTTLPGPSPTPRACSNSCPLNQ